MSNGKKDNPEEINEWEELTKKDPNWKKNNWDKWSFWRKIRHILAVIFGVILIACMGIALLLFAAWLPDPYGWIKEILINIIRN